MAYTKKLIKDDGDDQSDAPSLSGTRISNHQSYLFQ